MSKLHYQIVTPERVVQEGEADSVSVMTNMGEITVLPHHVPLLSLMKAGELTIRNGGNTEYFASSTGMFEVRDGSSIVVLADTAERSDELELDAITAAKQRAEDGLAAIKNGTATDFADATAHLEREMARYRVAMKKGKSKQHRAEA